MSESARDGERSLALAREKLEHFKRERVLAVDPNLSFTLDKRIEQLEDLIRSWSSNELAPSGETTVSDEVAQLHAELRRREANDEDATEVLMAVLHARRQRRAGLGLHTGDRLHERYRLDEIAGAGGFATVWKAWDVRESKYVAVKVLHHQHAADQSRVERFVSGARQMAKLDHPGIARVLVDHALDPRGHHYFVMDWHVGGDLARAIKEQRITAHAALRALTRVAAALDHAHARGVIHRDVKPANILLDAAGNLVLADFDLVDALDTTHGTRTAGMGTFKYAAPEQLEDASKVDGRADVYGLGMTALHCLIGRDPPALVAVAQPKLLEGLDCAVALRTAIRRAVAYEVEKRARDCGELGRALAKPEVAKAEPRVRGGVQAWVGIAMVGVLGAAGMFALVKDGASDKPEPDRGSDKPERDTQPKQPEESKIDETPTGVTHTALAGTKTPLRLIGLTGGEFTIGSPNSESGRDTDEGPQHRVVVAPFEMCATEVSLAQYDSVMGTRPNDCNFEGCKDEHPVTSVSWEDAVRFMNALTRRENEQGAKLTLCYDETTWAWDRSCTGYRLPTEAQWEYAARAGSTTAWSFGAQEKDLCKYANTGTDACDDGFEKLAPVETSKLQPNAWGLHGMHGNVYEWVFDVDAPYGKERVENPAITTDGDLKQGAPRVLRGGSFDNRSQFTRSADRFGLPPEVRNWNIGFRCARGAVPQP